MGEPKGSNEESLFKRVSRLDKKEIIISFILFKFCVLLENSLVDTGSHRQLQKANDPPFLSSNVASSI